MDIHKPKAAHSWREFAVEIGTIIVGILIALSLEQAVELSRGQHELAEARKALAAELGVNAGRVLQQTDQDPCIDVRLKLLEAWAAGTARVPSANLASIDNRPLLASLRTSAWEVTKTGAVAAHMPVSERLAYASIYDKLANQAAIITSERQGWIELSRFAGEDRLDAADAKALRQDIGLLRANDAGRRFNTPGIVADIARLGIKPTRYALPPGRTAHDLCDPPK
jgi:hypothetical protein